MSSEVVNAADLAIFAGAIEQICSEMDTALERCAFSPIISEAVDRASGIYSAVDGGVIAQGHRGLPIFAGCMQYSVQAFLADVEDPQPGDVYMLNDPYRGGTHLMDVRLITPFHVGGELVCVLANTAHWADMGGSVPEASDRAPCRSMRRACASAPRGSCGRVRSTGTSSRS